MKERIYKIGIFILVLVYCVVAAHIAYPAYPQSQEAFGQNPGQPADEAAERLEFYFDWCEIEVKDLLSNWNDSTKQHKYYDHLIPCFCGNTTDIRYRVISAERRLERTVNSSKSASNHLESIEWRTKKSLEAECLPSQHSKILLGINNSLDAIDHTNTMLDMITSGNFTMTEVYAEAEAARDCHYRAAHEFGEAVCGYSELRGEAMRMSIYSYDRGDKLHFLMETMYEDMQRGKNVSMIVCINTDRKRWGFCDE